MFPARGNKSFAARYDNGESPVADAAVAIEHALQQLLLERMLLHFGLVDRRCPGRAACSAARCGPVCSTVKPSCDHVLPPRHVGVDRFADDVARLREAELQRGRGADRPLRIVRGEGDAMGLGQRGDAPRFAEAAAVRDVELADLAGARRRTGRGTPRGSSRARRSRSAC